MIGGIYDLWADIRAWWKVADYYEFKGKALDTLKNVSFGEVHGEPKITLVPYQLVIR